MLRTKEHNRKIGDARLRRGRSDIKKCPRCERDIPRNQYGLGAKGRTQSYCPQCVRDSATKRQMRFFYTHPEKKEHWAFINRKTTLKSYGLNHDSYDELLRNQKGLCAICNRKETAKRNGVYKNLSVDHNHTTGKVRGLLCQRCNVSIGLFEDRPDFMLNAIKYLQSTTEARGWPPFQRFKGNMVRSNSVDMPISEERKQELLTIANAEEKDKRPKLKIKSQKVIVIHPHWYEMKNKSYKRVNPNVLLGSIWHVKRDKSFLPARFPRRARCTLER